MVLAGLGEQESHGKRAEVSVGEVGVGDLYEVGKVCLELSES